MIAMKRKKTRSGFTLVEVMIAMFLASVAAVIVYTEMLLSYRILMRSRARLEAQSIAFDNLWQVYNRPDPVKISGLLYSISTPEWSLMSTNGWVDCYVTAETNITPRYWEIWVTVWPPTNSPLQIGTNPLARVGVWRWDAKR
jgi:prepilin-type N-terminal cleavage/methylation domain-containing protein